MTTRRAMIEAALEDGPLTGAQVRDRLPAGAFKKPANRKCGDPVNRQLCAMAARGELTRRLVDGLWTYALPDYAWPAPRRATVWDWRERRA